LIIAISVIVIACPCALAFARALIASLIGISFASEKGNFGLKEGKILFGKPLAWVAKYLLFLD